MECLVAATKYTISLKVLVQGADNQLFLKTVHDCVISFHEVLIVKHGTVINIHFILHPREIGMCDDADSMNNNFSTAKILNMGPSSISSHPNSMVTRQHLFLIAVHAYHLLL